MGCAWTTSSASLKTERAMLTANLSKRHGTFGKSYFKLTKSFFSLKRLRCMSAYTWVPHGVREGLILEEPFHWQCWIQGWSHMISRKEWVNRSNFSSLQQTNLTLSMFPATCSYGKLNTNYLGIWVSFVGLGAVDLQCDADILVMMTHDGHDDDG